MESIIGRKREKVQLKAIVESLKSEFLAIYGRRRVGKTFLIREFFDYKFSFQISGLANANTVQQLSNFHSTLNAQSKITYEESPPDWMVAFRRLISHLESIENTEKKVIFIDEMPWFDTTGSDFVMALEHFWNSWATTRKDIILIACGSAAAWMMNNLIYNTGGLHNRITQRMKVEPFCLQEVETFFESKFATFDRYQIAQLYMALGGIPYYLDAVKPELSATQNIQNLFFETSGILQNEFQVLYRSLFNKYELYEKVVEALSSKTYGLQRNEIIKTSGISSGGSLTRILSDLEQSGFITAYSSLDNKSKNIIYRLSDYYTLFYFKFIQSGTIKGKNAWLNLIDHPTVRAWQGITFEQICIDHSEQIKKALGISGVMTNVSTWRGKTDTKTAQIDLLIDRRDQVINVCEAKFSLNSFIIDKDYADKLRNKVGVFKQISKTKKSVFLTMITTYGIEKNKHSLGLVQNEVLMDDLFE
jgi:uncharacterized protein